MTLIPFEAWAIVGPDGHITSSSHGRHISYEKPTLPVYRRKAGYRIARVRISEVSDE